MKTTHSLFLAALVLAVVAAACGGADEVAQEPGTGAIPPAAGACLAGDPDCDDLGGQPTGDEPLFFEDEPTDGAPPSDGGQPLVGGGLTISEVLESQIDGGFAISGFFYDDGTGPLLCEALAESFPPQCGVASIPVDNSAGVELDGLVTEGDITWTDQSAVLIGEVVDGVFVVAPFGN